MELKPTRKEIAERAYVLWKSDGGPLGKDLDYWNKAEIELLAEQHDWRIHHDEPKNKKN